MFKTVSKKGNSIIEISTTAYKRAVTDTAWTDTWVLVQRIKAKIPMTIIVLL